MIDNTTKYYEENMSIQIKDEINKFNNKSDFFGLLYTEKIGSAKNQECNFYYK